MQNNQNLAIGVLSVTAIVLLVGVILTTVGGSREALATGQLDRGGDYILVTGQFSKSTEVVYVTDAAARQLNVYSYDQNRHQLILWDVHNLRREFGALAP